MIEKILFIKNVGKFANYSAHGEVAFEKLTLIFGENGRGKTMLSALLRSLGSGDPQYLLERKSVKSTSGPEASVRVDATNHIFKTGIWDSPANGIVVFDTTFINDNVYSGVYVEHDHKRNLYRFIVGETGVKLANAVDEFDLKIRTANDEIKSKEKQVQPHISGKLEVKKFCDLPLIPNVDKEIGEKEADVAALKQAVAIAARSALAKLSLPTVSLTEVEGLLTKKLEDIAQSAERLTKEHIARCMDAEGEDWINRGLGYVKEGLCPFCGQSLTGQELITAYKAYFSEAYAALKAEITQMIERMSTDFSQEAMLGLQRSISSNSSHSEFWKGYVAGDYPAADFDALKNAWTTLQNAINSYLKRKAAAPLESLTLEKEAKEAFRSFGTVTKKVVEYNARVEAMNVLIGAKKKKAAGGNQALAETKLEELRNAKNRHTNEVIKNLCEEYNQLLKNKETLEGAKANAKTALETYAKGVLSKYESGINEHLNRFGAGFKICNTGTKYPGGKPTTDYQLSIDDTPVNLGESKTASTGPCFKNTLSAGDKSTLAFSFFVAQLESDPDLSNKIVVFDDPVSSLDSNRRHCTQQVVRSLCQKAKQVVVLSHDPQFLLSIWSDEKLSTVKNLQIVRSGQASDMGEWDIEKATRDTYLQNYFSLDEYIEKGNVPTRDIARCIRPLLEGNLRLRFPKAFTRNEWLGDFIAKIRSAASTDPLSMLKPKLSELEALNEYSKSFHHDPDNAKLDDAELQSYSARALRFVSGV